MRGFEKVFFFKLLLLSIALVAIISVSVNAQQYANMGTINMNETKFSQIVPGSRHSYNLVVSSPMNIQIQVYNDGSPLDPYVELYSNGQLVGSDDDGAGYPNCSLNTFVNNGMYTIVVRGFSDSSSGNYRLMVNSTGGVSNPYNSMPQSGSGQSQMISVGQTVNNSISYSGERDSYTLTVTAPMNVVISMTKTNGELDCYLELLDSYGNQLITDDDGGGFPNSRISYYLNPGQYTIICRDLGSGIGGYVLSLNNGY